MGQKFAGAEQDGVEDFRQNDEGDAVNLLQDETAVAAAEYPVAKGQPAAHGRANESLSPG
jgi:hypothetical protein